MKWVKSSQGPSVRSSKIAVAKYARSKRSGTNCSSKSLVQFYKPRSIFLQCEWQRFNKIEIFQNNRNAHWSSMTPCIQCDGELQCCQLQVPNVRLFKTKNRVFKFEHLKMNLLESVQCSKKWCLFFRKSCIQPITSRVDNTFKRELQLLANRLY